MYGYSKSKRVNLHDDEEEQQFKDAAKFILSLTEEQLAELMKRGDFVEVKGE